MDQQDHGHKRQPRVGIGVAVIREHEVLLVRRLHHGAGSWSAPGGYLDYGESFDVCAKRETREETGVEIEDVTVCAVTNDIHPDGKHNVTVWLSARPLAGEARVLAPDEVDAVEWFPRDALPEPLYRPTRAFFSGQSFSVEARSVKAEPPRPEEQGTAD